METVNICGTLISLLLLSSFVPTIDSAVRRDSKPGSCPYFPGLSSCDGLIDSCHGDYDCPRAEKCCRVGCKKICLDPSEVQDFTSGDKCPLLPRRPACTTTQNECHVGSPCTSPLKCCSDGCSYRCVQPVTIPTTPPREWKTCQTAVDLALLVDSSGSISKTNYKKLKAFIIYIVRSFGVSYKGSHVSLILYSNSATVKAGFGQFYSTEAFVYMVRSLPHEKGQTRIDKALTRAAELFKGSRRNVPRIAMVLTDGEQTKVPDAMDLRSASAPLRAVGVRVLAFGVAKKVNERELRLMVERDEDVIHVESFNELIANTKGLTRSICQASTTEPVHQDSDILFLMDSSSDVTAQQFNSQKNLVRDLTRKFIISPLGPRAALVTYATQAVTVIGFSGFTTIPDFSIKINDAPLLGGQRRIDKALASAATIFTQTSRSAIRILVLMTAGNYDADLSSAMQRLASLGVHVYVVGIGSKFNSTLYGLVASSRDSVFAAPSFGGLGGIQQDLARRIRLGSTAVSAEPSEFAADVVFLMDSSDGVSPRNYNTEKNYVKLMAKLLNLAHLKTRAAVFLYNHKRTQLVNSFGYDEYDTFVGDVNGAPQLGGARGFRAAFEEAAKSIRSGRHDVPKFVILITSGESVADQESAESLSELSKPLHELGAGVFILCVGSGVDVGYFLPLVEAREDIFPVASFDDVFPAAVPMARRAMASWGLEGIPKQTRFSADIVFAIDASRNVDPARFSDAKEFVKRIFRVLSGPQNPSRAGLVVYAYDAEILLGLDSYRNLSNFEEITDGAPYLGGTPRIDHALSKVDPVFGQARPSVPWILVFLTTGPETPGMLDWAESTRSLRERGVWPYFVAIGEQLTPSELRPALVEPGDVFPVVSFRDLPLLDGPIAKHILADKFIYGPPDHTLDLLFLVDSAESASRDDFQAQKDFVRRLAWHLGLMQGTSRGALVSYGDTPDIVATFNDYSNASRFFVALDSSPMIGGDRRIDRALETAAVLVLQSRFRLPKAVILFTAGAQVGNETLTEALTQLRKLGVWIFVVSVDLEAEGQQVQLLTASAEDLFQSRSFEELGSIVGPFGKHVMNSTRAALPSSHLAADTVFIIDASQGIRFEQYKEEQAFVLSLARYLNIDLHSSRAALVTYGFRPFVRYAFSDNDGDQAKFTTAVARAPYIGGARDTAKAVDAAMNLLQDARDSFSKIVVLLTAGEPSGPDSLGEILRRYRGNDVRTYVISTWSDMTRAEVESAVEKPQDAFIVDEGEDLEDQATPIARHVNFDSVLLAPPAFAADVIFLLDSSRDISLADFSLEKTFIRFLGRYLRIGTKNTRAGLVTYGAWPKLLVDLGAYNTSVEFYSSVDKADYIGGDRRLDRLLDSAVGMFSAARPAVPKVLVLFTAGDKLDDSEAGKIAEALQRLQSMGVKLYVISVGKVDTRVKVAKSSDMFVVRSYKNLPILVFPLAMHMFTDTASLGPPNFKADIIFMVDTSAGVSAQNYKLEKNFVKLIMRHLNIVPGKSHAAFIVYNTSPAVVSPLYKFTSTSAFVSSIDRASYLGGGRRIDRALSSAASQLEDARPSVRKIAFLLTSEEPLDASELVAAQESVRMLEKVGASVYVVAVGSGDNEKQLGRLVREPGDLLRVLTYQQLPLRTQPIAGRITSQGGNRKPQNLTMHLVVLLDSSDGVTAQEYKDQKALVKGVLRTLDLHAGGSRVDVLAYSDKPGTVATLEAGLTAKAFGEAVDNLPQLSGRKNLHGAVDGAEAFLRKGNHAVKYVILLTKGRQDREPEAETLLSKIDAQNLVVFFNDVRDSNEASGFVLLRSSSDLESNVDEISRRVMAAYVAPRPGVPSCPGSLEVECSDDQSDFHACQSDSDCSSSSRRCCFDGCKNVCYDSTPVTPTTGSGSRFSTVPTKPTVESNTSDPTTPPHTKNTTLEPTVTIINQHTSPDEQGTTRTVPTKPTAESITSDPTTPSHTKNTTLEPTATTIQHTSTDEQGTTRTVPPTASTTEEIASGSKTTATERTPDIFEVTSEAATVDPKTATSSTLQGSTVESVAPVTGTGSEAIVTTVPLTTARTTGEVTPEKTTLRLETPVLSSTHEHSTFSSTEELEAVRTTVPSTERATPEHRESTRETPRTSPALTEKSTPVQETTAKGTLSTEDEKGRLETTSATKPVSLHEVSTDVRTDRGPTTQEATTETIFSTASSATVEVTTGRETRSQAETTPSSLPRPTPFGTEQTIATQEATAETIFSTASSATVEVTTGRETRSQAETTPSSLPRPTPFGTEQTIATQEATAETIFSTASSATVEVTSGRENRSQAETTPSSLPRPTPFGTEQTIATQEATAETIFSTASSATVEVTSGKETRSQAETTPSSLPRSIGTEQSTATQDATDDATAFITGTATPLTTPGYGRVCPRIKSKDMQCPVRNVCQRNSDCPGDKMCCYHACRRTVCVNPATKEQIEEIRRQLDRPGECPILSRPEVCPTNRIRVCNYDVDCRASPDLKCCDNGCAKKCVPPAGKPTAPPDGNTGRCPPYSPNQKCPEIVQDDCTCDSDCDGKEKCCFDGCRRICRKTAGRVCAANVDIVYLMDSSASIGPYEYEQEKSFVKDLARIFQEGGTRAGVVIYSDDPEVMVKFDEKNDLESFAKAVDEIEFLGNRTRIDKALESVSKLFLTARREVPKILIVLTDGRQTQDPDSVPLLRASQPLRDQGVKTYAIGVGHDIDKEELRALVDEPSDVFYVGSFGELIRQSQTIAEEACKGAENLCTKHADVGFLVDASESITKEDFQKQKNAVNGMARNFLQSSGESRVGVIVYSDQPELSIDFGEYSTKEDLYRRVNGLPHKMSHTRTDLALKFANRTLFTGTRRNVPKIAIVFTDGIQTPGNGVESLNKAVQPLLRKGVRVFAVSVGTTVDMDELQAMVQNPEDVYQVASFSELVDKASDFAQATCNAPAQQVSSTPAPQTTPPSTTSAPERTATTTAAALPRSQCRMVLDIVFVMDSSRSINASDYAKQKNFVKELASILNVGAGSRAAVIIYSDDPELKIRFDDFSNLEDFNDAVDALPFIMRRTRIDKALKMASDVLSDARSRVPKAVLVMTDGIQSRDSDALSLNRAAVYVVEKGARILVIGIGPKIVREELNLMVKSPAHLFTVESFDSLIRAARNVALRTCATPVLKPSNKTLGLCPDLSGPSAVCLSTADKCSNDQSCSGGDKCCYDGCLYKCVEPILPTEVAPAVKPGFCPGGSRFDCNSAFDLCRDDQSCSGPDKCCFDGCRFLCTAPKDDSVDSTDSTIQHGQECSGTFDLGFVVDTSSAVGEAGFNLEKEFVKSLAEKFSIGEVQLGLVLFSDAPLLFVRFGGASSTSLDEFKQSVDRLPYLRGQARIDRALETASVHLFPGGRVNVPKTLVLITRGIPASGSQPLTDVARKLRDRNVKVLVVGFGRGVDRRGLGVLVEDPAADLFLASSLENVEPLEERLETALCSSFGKRRKLRRS